MGQLTSGRRADSTAESTRQGAAPVTDLPSDDGGIPTFEQTDPELERVRQWARMAARAAAFKGGDGTVILEVGRVLAITDAFVITSGRNHRQVATIAQDVEARLKADAGIAPLRTEGASDLDWVLLDYGDFVVHVFLEEVRVFYDLERLWSDAPRVEWEDESAASPGRA